jgi:hypothetical protein
VSVSFLHARTHLKKKKKKKLHLLSELLSPQSYKDIIEFDNPKTLNEVL